jgi:hypothetical protein
MDGRYLKEKNKFGLHQTAQKARKGKTAHSGR